MNNIHTHIVVFRKVTLEICYSKSNLNIKINKILKFDNQTDFYLKVYKKCMLGLLYKNSMYLIGTLIN